MKSKKMVQGFSSVISDRYIRNPGYNNYITKGKKCIGLLILCITCLLSLNLFSNASAITVKGYRNPTSIEWIYNPGGINQTANTTSSSIIRNINFNLVNQNIENISNLTINLNSNINVSKKVYFKFDLIYIINADGITNDYVALPVCPIGASNYTVQSCTYEQISRDQALTIYREYPYTDPNNNTYWEWTATAENSNIYYIMHITGNYGNENATAKTTINFNRAFFYALNNIYPLGNNLYLTLIFSPITFYEEEESAEEEAAEKELEDRDNLESQSTTTDNQADSAGQSAETTGTTLFAAFSQFFNALTNVSGASCVLPNMQVYSLNLGQMDLCTYDIPPQIMALVSIGMVFIIVPLGIHLVKRMLSLYKEITG